MVGVVAFAIVLLGAVIVLAWYSGPRRRHETGHNADEPAPLEGARMLIEEHGHPPLTDQVDDGSTSDAVLRSHRIEKGTRELRELLREEQVTIAFQPIVLLSRSTVAGYEALGRGRHPQLPEEPRELFRIAETIGAEAELSRLFRRKAVELIARRSDLPVIFLNTHPAEFTGPGLLESLEELRAIAPHTYLALEIHESVLAGPSAIAELRAFLAERNIALAFDNFGSGQARLHELAETPPHYLKFHPRFVRDLDQVPAGKRHMLHSLLALAREFSPPIKTVAEGIETEAEARACAETGFSHGQGLHLGRPRSIERI